MFAFPCLDLVWMMFELARLELGLRDRRLLGPQSLGLPEGGPLVITGPSGCGKSTLLMVLAGLRRPEAGRLFFRGGELKPGTLVAHRRRAHLVFQQPVLPGASLREALGLGLLLRGLPPPEDGRLREELAALGLGRLELDGPPAGLSGGERMRVALLRGLLLPLDLLLLDEPTTGLDDESALALTARLAAPGVPPLLSASHDPRWAAFCPRRLDMREGLLHAA
jgi:ABC-type lipoprotein export system ATPase subunit